MKQSKSQKQSELCGQFFLSNCNGIMDIVMGFGKTKLGMMISDRYIRDIDGEILILGASFAVANHWETSFIKELGHIPESINISTVESIRKLPDFDIDLLIIDEIHKFTTDVRYELINGSRINYKHILGLTGTMPSGYNRRLLTRIAPVIAKIEEEESIENGWTSPYNEYNVRLEFSDADKQEYVERTIPIRDTLRKWNGVYKRFQYSKGDYMFNNDLDLILSCFRGKSTPYGYVKGETIRNSLSTKMGYNEQLDLSTDYGIKTHRNWSPSGILEASKTFILNMDYRNELLVDNNTKLSAVRMILDKFKDKTSIVFNGNINFAEAVKNVAIHNIKDYSAVTYHSKLRNQPLIDQNTGRPILYKSGKNKGAIRLFGQKMILNDILEGVTSGRYDMISVVNTFNEGVDIPNLDLVVTTSGTTNMITHKQRTGRGKRYYGDKVSTIINLYFDDFTYTNDEGESKLYRSRDKSKLAIRTGGLDIDTIYTLTEFLSLKM